MDGPIILAYWFIEHNAGPITRRELGGADKSHDARLLVRPDQNAVANWERRKRHFTSILWKQQTQNVNNVDKPCVVSKPLKSPVSVRSALDCCLLRSTLDCCLLGGAGVAPVLPLLARRPALSPPALATPILLPGGFNPPPPPFGGGIELIF